MFLIQQGFIGNVRYHEKLISDLWRNHRIELKSILDLRLARAEYFLLVLGHFLALLIMKFEPV